MLVWPAAGAVFATFNVFQTSGLDYRLIALGALAPLIVDLPAGEQSVGHALITPTVGLALVMAVTIGRGRKLRRRRWIAFPIGWYAGLVLLGAWRTKEVFWWPLFGTEGSGVSLLASWPVVVVAELIGLVALRWIWLRFGLRDPSRRRVFVRSGRLSPV